MAKEFYIVQVDRPEGVTVSEMSAYIQESVNAWSGGFDPQDPLFGHFHKFGKGAIVQRMVPGTNYSVGTREWSDRNRVTPHLAKMAVKYGKFRSKV